MDSVRAVPLSMSERSPVALRLALLARTAARRGNLFEARIRMAEALRIDARAVTRQTWDILVRAHEDSDAVSLATFAMLCARDPTGRAFKVASGIVPQRLLYIARRRAS